MQTDKNLFTEPVTIPDKPLETDAADIKARIRQAITAVMTNTVACGLGIVTLVSFLFPENWESFGHVLQGLCFMGALALVFSVVFQKLIIDLKKQRGGERRESVLCVTAALVLLVGMGALVLATYSPDDRLAFALRLAGLILFALSIAVMTWAFVLRIKDTRRIVRLSRKLKTTDDEAELRALAAEIDRIMNKS